MKDAAGYVEVREREARRANLALRAEILTILLFLPGLGLLVTMIVLLNTIVVMKILPEEAAFLGPDLLPNFSLGPGPIAVVVLVFLIPAGLFMSAGVVLRRFLLRD